MFATILRMINILTNKNQKENICYYVIAIPLILQGLIHKPTAWQCSQLKPQRQQQLEWELHRRGLGII